MGDAEAAAAVGLAVQQQPRAGRVALDQPRLVEEASRASSRWRRPRAPRPAGACPGGAPGARRSSAPRPPRSPARRRAAPPACAPRGCRWAGARAGPRPCRSPSVLAPAAIRLPGRRQRGRAGATAAASARARRAARSRASGSRRRERADGGPPARRAPPRRWRERCPLAVACICPQMMIAPRGRQRRPGRATRRPAATSRPTGRRGAARARSPPLTICSSSPSASGASSPASTLISSGAPAASTPLRELGHAPPAASARPRPRRAPRPRRTRPPRRA